MILKLKQRSFKYYFLFLVSFVFPLVVFFMYATHYQTRFFAVIALALAFNIVVLFSFHRRLKRKKSQVKLQREEYFEKANLLKADLDKEWQVIGAFRQKIIAYNQLRGLVEKVSVSMSVEDTAYTLCHEAADLFGHGDITVVLYVIDQHTGDLGIASAQRHGRSINIKNKRGDIFDRWVMKTLQPLHLEDTKEDFRFDLDKIEDEEMHPLRALLSVPLLVHNRPIGLIRMDSPMPGRFTKEDLRFLRAIGDVAAVAIENALLYDKVEDLAIRDGLTGLFLRRHMVERLGEEINRHLRKEKELAVVMLDLDHFKQYNDTFGHTAGDIVLKNVAAMMLTHFKAPGNIICRYGGEEFCVILTECSKKDAFELTRKFVERVDKEDVVLRREKTHVTISAGVAAFPKDAKTKEDLIQKADDALYHAKNKGRNRASMV